MKYPIKIASAMAAYYAVTGVYQNYISKYFGAQGLTVLGARTPCSG